MVEVFFIIYYIPTNMTRLAREHKRSAVAWSLLGIGAWLAGELIVWLVFTALYEAGKFLWGWPVHYSSTLRLLVYSLSLAAAGGCLIFVERTLESKSRAKSYPLPPPPPKFE